MPPISRKEVQKMILVVFFSGRQCIHDKSLLSAFRMIPEVRFIYDAETGEKLHEKR